MLRAVQARWRWLLAIEPADECGPGAVRFEVRSGARVVVRALMTVGAFGYALLAVAAIVGPGLSFFVRALMLAVATAVGALQLIWLERRGIRACVVATPAGICVFNGLRTHFVPWSQHFRITASNPAWSSQEVIEEHGGVRSSTTPTYSSGPTFVPFHTTYTFELTVREGSEEETLEVRIEANKIEAAT